MKKVRNKKQAFAAYRRSNNTFQIKNMEGILKPGQRILISQETDEPIIHFSTGKEIGKVEIKLGVGSVLSENPKRGTVTVRVGSKKSVHPLDARANRLNISLGTPTPEEFQRIAAIKGIAMPKSYKKKTPAKYIAKIIE